MGLHGEWKGRLCTLGKVEQGRTYSGRRWRSTAEKVGRKEGKQEASTLRGSREGRMDSVHGCSSLPKPEACSVLEEGAGSRGGIGWKFCVGNVSGDLL